MAKNYRPITIRPEQVALSKTACLRGSRDGHEGPSSGNVVWRGGVRLLDRKSITSEASRFQLLLVPGMKHEDDSEGKHYGLNLASPSESGGQAGERLMAVRWSHGDRLPS